MKKKVVVISLGGSQIIHDNKINIKFLSEFKKILKKNSARHKFIVVCGGGSLARMYIAGLLNSGQKLQSFAGIAATRTNARFVSYFFGKDPEKGIPHKIREVKKQIRKKEVIFCGALEYKPEQTSDSTSAQIAQVFGCEFINITNVAGLFDKHPKLKGAKFVSNISWKEFNKIANKMKYKPGQHFVLDQKASKIIRDNKIKTYILGQNLKNLDGLLKEKKFRGTTIGG